jgi:hypothetical protein
VIVVKVGSWKKPEHPMPVANNRSIPKASPILSFERLFDMELSGGVKAATLLLG